MASPPPSTIGAGPGSPAGGSPASPGRVDSRLISAASHPPSPPISPKALSSVLSVASEHRSVASPTKYNPPAPAVQPQKPNGDSNGFVQAFIAAGVAFLLGGFLGSWLVRCERCTNNLQLTPPFMPVNSIILMIGDGFGPAYLTLAREHRTAQMLERALDGANLSGVSLATEIPISAAAITGGFAYLQQAGVVLEGQGTALIDVECHRETHLQFTFHVRRPQANDLLWLELEFVQPHGSWRTPEGRLRMVGGVPVPDTREMWVWTQRSTPLPAQIGVQRLMVRGAANPQAYIRRVRLIGSGCEFHATPRLHLDSTTHGTVATRSTDWLVTDSAAAGTALATGLRTMNHWIGEVWEVQPDGRRTQRPVGTILEGAQAAGLRTGLVTTARLSHATTAAFSAHTPDRSNEDLIAQQQLYHGIDVLFGGGKKFFTPADRVDGLNLLESSAALGYGFINDSRGLASWTTNRNHIAQNMAGKALGLFSRDHLPYALDSNPDVPTLKQMTKAAIDKLSENAGNFFLMVEGGRIDHAGHANDAPAAIQETLAFDDAVGVALEYVSSRDDVLLVVTADHETGGMSASCCGQLGANHTALALAIQSSEAMVRDIHKRAHLMQVSQHLAEEPPDLLVENVMVFVQDVVSNGTQILEPLPPDVAYQLAEIAINNVNAAADPFNLSTSVCSVWWSVDAVEACGEFMLRLDGGSGLQYALAEWLAHNRYQVGFTTHTHTSVDVLLFAAGGPKMRLEPRVWANDELGRELLRLLAVDPEAGLQRARTALLEAGVPLV